MVGYCGAGRLQQSLKISMLPIRDGFECWFTFVIYPVVELTNNREKSATRACRSKEDLGHTAQ